MVNCWFGSRWFGFLGFICERDWDSWVHPTDLNPKPLKDPKQQGKPLDTIDGVSNLSFQQIGLLMYEHVTFACIPECSQVMVERIFWHFQPVFVGMMIQFDSFQMS